ncbi:MAG: TlpA family protein disulfide reductase, partial [Calditrichaeota bacterium]
HNFTVLAINVDNQRENMEKFLSKQENQPGFPIIVDPQGKIPGLYNIQGMPTTVLIDKTGRIRYQQTGFKAQDKSRMIKAIKKLL